MIRLGLLVALVAAPALAAAVPAQVTARAEARLARIVAGRTAGEAKACIRPESRVQPVVIDGQALVYREGSTAYVGRFADACPILREERTIVTASHNGSLCKGDIVRVVETGMLLGHCVFADFTPYARAR